MLADKLHDFRGLPKLSYVGLPKLSYELHVDFRGFQVHFFAFLESRRILGAFQGFRGHGASRGFQRRIKAFYDVFFRRFRKDFKGLHRLLGEFHGDFKGFVRRFEEF